MEQINHKKEIIKAFVVGTIAAIIGAVIWAGIVALTNYQIGYIAILIGAIVGWSIHLTTHATTISYSIIGAILSLLGCVIGDFLATAYIVSSALKVPYFEFLKRIYVLNEFQLLIQSTYQMTDILFYGLSAYAGFKFSRIKQEVNNGANQ